MARLSTSGFETNNLLQTEWSSIPTQNGTLAIITTTPHSGTYCLQAAQGGSAGHNIVLLALTSAATSGTHFLSFAFKIVTDPGAYPHCVASFRNSGGGSTGGGPIEIHLISGPKLAIRNRLTATTTNGTTTLSLNTWYVVQIKVVIADSPNGSVELKIGTNVEASQTNTDTLDGTNGMRGFQLGGQLGDGATSKANWEYHYDDVILNDATGSFQTDYPAIGSKIALMVPSSDVAVAWTKAGTTPAATNWQGVDDEPGTPNDGTDFNQKGDASGEDKLGASSLPAEVPSNADMISMDVYGRVGSDATGTRTMALKVWDEAGTGTQGPSVNCSINGWKILATAEHQVFDLGTRTKANVNSFNIGYVSTGGASANKNISALWANVEWIESADITLALTGVAATAAVGIVGAALALALSGVLGTASPGSAGMSAALSGVSGTSSVGTVTPQTSAPLAGVAGTGAVGTVAPQVSLPLAGVLGTGAVGAVAPQASVALAGVAATGAVGTVAPQSSAPLTGVAATGAVGTVTASISGDLTLPLTGVAGTGAVGAVAPQLSVPLTGVAGAGAVGSVGIGAALSGVSATGSPGTLAPQASAPLTGVLGTGAVGTVAPQTSIPLTGVLGTGAVGTVAPQVSVALLGVAGTGAVGTVGPQASIALLGVAGTGAAGTASPAISKALTGVAATGAVGTVTASIGGDLTLPLTGVAAAGSVGGVAPQTSVALTGVAPTAAVGELTAGVLRPAGMRPGAGPGTVRGSPHMASRTADSPDSSRAADLPGSNRGADIPTSKRS